jgi:hypothetical protein
MLEKVQKLSMAREDDASSATLSVGAPGEGAGFQRRDAR